MSKLDPIEYAIDFLPTFVEVGLPNGKKAVYGLKVLFKGVKGFSAGYWLDTDYCDIDTSQEETWSMMYDFVEQRFGEDACPNCLFGADYIRSLQHLERFFRRAYRFLRKHNLCERRSHNIRSKQKLFVAEFYG